MIRLEYSPDRPEYLRKWVKEKSLRASAAPFEPGSKFAPGSRFKSEFITKADKNLFSLQKQIRIDNAKGLWGFTINLRKTIRFLVKCRSLLRLKQYFL